MPFRSPSCWATACFRRPEAARAARRLWNGGGGGVIGRGWPCGAAALIAAVTLLIGTAGTTLAQNAKPPRVPENQVSLFVGKHVDNTWQDVFRDSDNLEYANTGLVGLGIGRNWRRPGAPFSFGVEFQADWQFGDQEHFEFNLPVVARYHLPNRVPALRSLAFGVGPSYASKVPTYEVDSRGDSQQFLMYWMMEAEFGPKTARNSGFVRLHHRSGMFGVVADEGASNALVLGVRHRW